MKITFVRFISSAILLVMLSSVYGQEATPDSRSENTENIRGLVKPRQRAVLSSEISGRITEIKYKSGQPFKKGDMLIKYDCSLYNADLASAKAKYEAEKKKFENNKKLLALNATSDIEVELSKATMDIAGAEMSIKEIITRHCIIIAPYNGRVIDVATNQHESVSTGQELISILDDQYLEIDLIVPSSWLTTLDEGLEFMFLVDETQKKYPAKIIQIGAIVDPVSQTVRLTGEFAGDVNDVLSGMSGTAIFDFVNN